jgi:hypothetical protein
MNIAQGIAGLSAGMDQGNARPQSNARMELLKKLEGEGDKFYQDTFRPMAMQAKQAYSSGDMQAFSSAVSELSRVSPFPYQFHMDGDGNFAETFRSTKDGGKYVPTGRTMTAQNVMQFLDGMLAGEQKVLRGIDGKVATVNPAFLAEAARYRLGTIIGNAETLSDESQWIEMQDGNGNTIYAIPQNRHDDYSAGTSYMILDEKNGQSGYANSLEELAQAGFSPVNNDGVAQQQNQDPLGIRQ